VHSNEERGLTASKVDHGRRQLLGWMAGGVTASLGLPGLSLAATNAKTRSITYYGDQTVVVPERIERVATTWEAQNAILAMLGFGDKIVATTRVVKDMPVFRHFVPSIGNAVVAGSSGGEINIEALMALKPDVLFVAGKLPPARMEQLRQVGIAVAAFKANSMAALIERTQITGEILGPEAARRASAYREYYEHNVARVSAGLAKVPVKERLKVYHCLGDPLATTGRPSLNQDWMDLAGAVNVAEHWMQGGGWNTAKVSLEQVLAADPDVIVSMRAQEAEQIRQDGRWRGLRAVREGRVYTNPRGMFWWCRETSEEAMQFLWLARTLYPDAFPDVDMRKETREFYQRFYGYRLSDDEVSDFLHPRA
jgi:iron complex transport system substrate-binding protein